MNKRIFVEFIPAGDDEQIIQLMSSHNGGLVTASQGSEGWTRVVLAFDTWVDVAAFAHDYTRHGTSGG